MAVPSLLTPGQKRTRSRSPKVRPLASRSEPQISIQRLVGKRLTIGVQFFETVLSTASCRMACYFHDRAAVNASSSLSQHKSGSPDALQTDGESRIPITNSHAHLTTVDLQGIVPLLAGKWINGEDASRLPVRDQSIEIVDSLWEDLQSKVSRDLSVEGFWDFDRSIVATAPMDWGTTRRNKVVDLLAATTLGKGRRISILDEIEAKVIRSLHGRDISEIQIGDPIMICDLQSLQSLIKLYEVVQLQPSLAVERVSIEDSYAGFSLMTSERQILRDCLQRTLSPILKSGQVTPKPAVSLISTNVMKQRRIRIIISNQNLGPAGLNGIISIDRLFYPWSLSSEDSWSMLSGLYDDIRLLVSQYRDSSAGQCRAILVAGDSEPITRRLHAKMRSGCYNVIRVPEASVIEGAALSQVGLRSTMQAQKHYGTEIWDIYDSRIDSRVPFIWDPYTETKVVTRMNWFVNTCDNISQDCKIMGTYCRILDENEINKPENLIFTDTLYECSDTKAPTHYTKGREIQCSRQIRSELRSVPRDRFVLKKGKNGLRCYIITFNLVVTLRDGEMSFSLEANGEAMGSVEFTF